jgi:hypothetical protein
MPGTNAGSHDYARSIAAQGPIARRFARKISDIGKPFLLRASAATGYAYNMPRRTILLTACLVLSHVPVAAQVIELEGRYWFANLDGSAQVTSDSVPGTKFDLTNDLGAEDENLPEVRLTFRTGSNSLIRLAYLYGKFEGDTILDQTIQFNGTTFAASTPVQSEFELHYGRLGWAYMFPVVPGIFRVGPLLEVKASSSTPS